MKLIELCTHLANFLLSIGKALQLPGGLDAFHLDLECVGGEALPVLVDLHLPPKVLDRPGEAEVCVLLGSGVTPGGGFHWGLLDLASGTAPFCPPAEIVHSCYVENRQDTNVFFAVSSRNFIVFHGSEAFDFKF